MTNIDLEGISVITPTMRKSQIHQVFFNFLEQRFEPKELIIIINNDEISRTEFEKLKPKGSNIYIYQVPESKTLGECLNIAIKKAKYNYIAKFDDDDYYAPFYLTEMYNAFKKEECDIVCKQSIFYYLEAYRKLILLSRIGQNKQVIRGAGATIGAKKSIFHEVQFAHRKRGTDTDFFIKCFNKKLKCYSTSSYNYLCFRSSNEKQHTWQVTAQEIEKKCKRCSNWIISYEEACRFINRYIK